MKKIFFNKIIKISKKEFVNYDKKKLLKEVLKGNIIIVSNAVNKSNLLKICKKINNKKIKESQSTKMLQGVGNIFYVAKEPKLIEGSSKKYIVSNRSWYFFPWNNDKSGLCKLVQPIFNHAIELNGFDHRVILKNTPKDGLVQRFHLMNYPLGKGFISRHIDPIKYVNVTAGIYVTEYGKDYDSGGFYVINKKRKKINIDKKIKSSDMVLFYPSMPHGVDAIQKKILKKPNISDGRWFLNLTLVASHHVRNRITSKGW